MISQSWRRNWEKIIPFFAYPSEIRKGHRLQQLGMTAIRSADLSRTHRERLVKNGFLQEVLKGWYIPAKPGTLTGESTAWYASFWNFCAGYLQHRLGEAWCLSPEQSLALHAGNRTVPRQLLVRSTKARNQTYGFLGLRKQNVIASGLLTEP